MPNTKGVYSYYPGCTLKTKAKELDRYARESAEALGITMEEIPEWQCCGAVYPMATDEIATRLSSVRALDSARREGRSLLTLCSACHHVIKRVNNDIRENRDIRVNVNNYLMLDEDYKGETRVVHYLEMLRDDVGFDKLKKLVKFPFKGKRIAAYYGCLLLRPSSVMKFDSPENPSIFEKFIEAIGAIPVPYPYRNECCAGYVAINDKAMPKRMCNDIISSAEENGAQMIVTACPMCRYNLDKHNKSGMTVHYFTQLLAMALGLDEGGSELDAQAEGSARDAAAN